MTEIIGVRFKAGGKQYYFDPNGIQVAMGDHVVVETGKGLEYGLCVRPNSYVNDDVVVQPLRPLVRVATEKDDRQVEENHRKEAEAMQICQQMVEHYQLDMKLVQVEYAFDGSKIIFFFTSEGRVDFRALVKDLAGVFRARIELRQIGVRDEARMLGGLGICGKPFCCHQFLEEFQPVSIKMAKTQNLSLNPTKISGTCGRLMCCLKYEQEAYEDAVKRCPKQDSFVECPDGVGTVSSVNLLKEQVKVKLEDSTEQPKSYRTDEIRVVRSGKGKRPEDYVAPPKEELEKLRYVPPEPERPRRGLGDPSELSARLEQYLGESSKEKEKEKEEQPKSTRSRNRRKSRGGQGKQAAQEEKPQEETKTQEKGKSQEKVQKQGKKPAKAAKAASAPAPAPAPEEGKPAEGEKKNRNRRRRYRKPKAKSEGSAGGEA